MAIQHGRTAVLAAVIVLALAAVGGLVTVAAKGQQPDAARRPAGADNPTQGPTPPAHGAFFGARVKGATYTDSADIAAVAHLQQDIGRRLAIVHVYHLWQDPFPSSSDLAFLRQGSTLLLSWSGTDTRAIAAGRYDSMIRQRALAVKALGRRIFLEWRWEMDRPGLQAQIHSPADYIAAWDHIRSIFAEEHVTNVGWVWCPTADGFATGKAPAYYPGNSAVDWVCADAYPGYGPYRSFANIVTPFLSWASQPPQAGDDWRVWRAKYLRAPAAGTMAPERSSHGTRQPASQGTCVLRRKCQAELFSRPRLSSTGSVSPYRPLSLFQPGGSALIVKQFNSTLRVPAIAARNLGLRPGRAQPWLSCAKPFGELKLPLA